MSVGVVCVEGGGNVPCIPPPGSAGPSSDIESNIQETGHGGRDGKLCAAILFHTKADQQYTQKSEMDYCVFESDAGDIKCRCQKLFDNIDGGVEDPHPTAIAVIFV